MTGPCLTPWMGSSGDPGPSSIAPVSTELTRRRAVDLLRVSTMLCRAL
jgi:hypothetical protein